MQRVLAYARRQNYTQYTSTLAEAWRLSISELSKAILQACDAHTAPPELDPDTDYRQDPIAAFGIVEAQRHRTRGISLSMFLGLLKYYRQSYVDLVEDSAMSPQARAEARLFVERCFDRIEIGFCSEWLGSSESERMVELQSTNRRMTNEKNKYLTIFESLQDPAVLLDASDQIVNINHAGLQLLQMSVAPGAAYYGEAASQQVIPWIEDIKRRLHESRERVVDFEMAVETKEGRRYFHVKERKMLDVSEKFRGSIVLLDDITFRKQAEERLAAYAHELALKNKQLNEDLDLAREVQDAFLPRAYPTFPRGLSPAQSRLRFHEVYRPTHALGGDFFDVLALSDDTAGVLICDVMGHGAQAALVTALIRGLLHQLMPVANDPGRLLTQLNYSLMEVLRSATNPILTTACYAVIEAGSGRTRYAAAAHPLPILLQRQQGTATLLGDGAAKPGPALGLFREARYANGETVLEPEDVLLLFTDGLFEVADPQQQYFGEDRLYQTARDLMALPAADLAQALFDEVRRFSGGESFDDDICLLAVEVAARLVTTA